MPSQSVKHYSKFLLEHGESIGKKRGMKDMTQACPGCGMENVDSAKFCNNCSKSLSQCGTSKLTFLDNRYEVISIIKSGAMGCVYKARDTRLNNTVALKKMFSSFTDPQETRYAEERFREEAQLLSKLHHGGLPKVLDFFIETDPETNISARYLVMTFIEGHDLEVMINERKQTPFPVDEALDYFRQILDILKYLHSQNPPVIYRDMNPRNIMLQNGKIFLVDFGIARQFNPEQKGTAIGTPGYASPEQYKGFAEPRSDLYSLGAVMHYLLTGINPEGNSQTLFTFEPVRTINPDVPEYLEQILMSMVDLVPAKRPSSAEAVERLLKATGKKTVISPSASLERYKDIFEAVKMNDLDAIKRFIRAGVNVNADSEAGVTPLYMAVISGNTETVQELIDEGADVNARNNKGFTPIHYAKELGHLEIAELLRRHGAIDEKKKPFWKPGRVSACPSHVQKPASVSITVPAIVILVVALLLGGDYYLRNRQKQYIDCMERARTALKIRKYDKAEEYAKTGLAIYPRDKDAKALLQAIYLDEVKRWYDEKDYSQCKELLSKLLALDADNAEGKKYRVLVDRKLRIADLVANGDEFFRAQDFKTSLWAYEEAVKLEPDNLLLKKKINKARQGETFLNILNNARKALKEGKFTTAEEAAERALKIDLEDKKARELLAEIRLAAASELLAKKAYKDAYYIALKILKDMPDNGKAADICNRAKTVWIRESLAKGVSLLQSKRLDEAKESFKTFMAIDPKNAEAKNYLDKTDIRLADRNDRWNEGNSYFSSGDYDSAISCYKEAIAIDSGNQSLRNALYDSCSKREKERITTGEKIVRDDSPLISVGSSGNSLKIDGTWQELGGVCSGNNWKIAQNGREITSEGFSGSQRYSWYGANISWSGHNVMRFSYIYTQKPSGWLNGTMTVTFQDGNNASVHCTASDRSLYDTVYSIKRVF